MLFRSWRRGLKLQYQYPLASDEDCNQMMMAGVYEIYTAHLSGNKSAQTENFKPDDKPIILKSIANVLANKTR